MRNIRPSKRLADQVRRTVRQALDKADKGTIVVGLSGGADSICLLDGLMAIAPQRVTAACFVDHGLRPDSLAEGKSAAAVAARLGAPFVARRVDTLGEMRRRGVSMETAARELRYGALRQVAAECGARYIAVGHTASDQAETVLMHIFRGSGIAGLVGMRPISGDLLRPLLAVDAAQCRAYCEYRELDVVEDPSNQDTTILRNRVRHEILPTIKQAFPGASQAVIRLAESAAADADFLTALAREADALDGESVSTGLPAAVLGHLDRLSSLRTPVGRTDDGESDWMQMTEPMIEPVKVLTPGVTRTGGLECHAIWRTGGDSETTARVAGLWSAFIDDADPHELFVRTWKPGDRIRPLGTTGSRKLHDVFVDHRVPAEIRDRIPVILADGRVVWVPGIVMAEGSRVKHGSASTVHLRFSRDEVGRHST